MANFYGPAIAAGAFSKAVGDLMGGLLESERRKPVIEDEEAARAAKQREQQLAAQMAPLEMKRAQQTLERGGLQMEAARQRMQLEPWEQVADQYGNITERNRLTGETRPVLSGQTKTQISGRHVFTMGPNGIQVSSVPASPQEEAAYKELGKVGLIKSPADRTKFLENWILTYGYSMDPQSPVLSVYKELIRAENDKLRKETVNKGFVTTQETETPRRPITDFVVRNQIKSQLIDPFVSRGDSGRERSEADVRFPGFDDPRLPVELKEKALGLFLKEKGYEGSVKLIKTPSGPSFVLTSAYFPGQVTERSTTRRPLTPAELGESSDASRR